MTQIDTSATKRDVPVTPSPRIVYEPSQQDEARSSYTVIAATKAK
jgi:hypothetical protein